MTNAASIGKTIFLSLLLVGAAVGFAGCKTSPPDVAGPSPVVCPDVTGEDQEINLDVIETKIVGDPYEVTVDVDKHDQAVWVWTGKPMNEFTVSLVWDRPNDPSAGLPEPGPPNPFIRSFGPIPGGGEGWESDLGKICSGRAKPAAKGHIYKFTVKSITNSGYIPLDPHVRFQR
jgi:hypothetical protein